MIKYQLDMKKILLTFIVLLSVAALAKGPVTVNVKEGSDNTEVQSFLELFDAGVATVTIYADSIDAAYYAIWMVQQTGNRSARRFMGYKYVTPDSTRFSITTMPKDSATVIVNVSNCSGAHRQTVAVPTAEHMLVACHFGREYCAADTIPLVAYTTGIPTKFDLGDGKTADGWYICGLRDSNVHPSQWKDRYHLPDYLYFEAIPVTKLDFSSR